MTTEQVTITIDKKKCLKTIKKVVLCILISVFVFSIYYYPSNSSFLKGNDTRHEYLEEIQRRKNEGESLAAAGVINSFILWYGDCLQIESKLLNHNCLSIELLTEEGKSNYYMVSDKVIRDYDSGSLWFRQTNNSLYSKAFDFQIDYFDSLGKEETSISNIEAFFIFILPLMLKTKYILILLLSVVFYGLNVVYVKNKNRIKVEIK